MKKYAVVYWSGSGNTQTMAGLVAEGIGSAGGEAEVLTAADFSADRVKDYDGFAFGCPAMGAEVLEESEFAPMFDAVKPLLKGRPVVLFGSYGWGDGEWMRSWEEDCREAGCILASESVTANGAPEGEAEAACRSLGVALAGA